MESNFLCLGSIGVVIALVLVANLYDHIIWVKRGRPDRNKGVAGEMTDGDFD